MKPDGETLRTSWTLVARLKDLDDQESWKGPGRFWLRDSRTADAIPLRTDLTELSWVSAFSPDGKRLAWGTEEGVVLVADLDEVKRRLAGLGHARRP